MTKLAGIWIKQLPVGELSVFSVVMCPSDSPDEVEEELELPQMSPGKERFARADETSNTRSNAECQLVRFSPVRKCVYRLINRIHTRDNDMKFNIRKEPK